MAHRAAQIPDGEYGVFKFYRWLLHGRGRGVRFVGAFESCIRARREQEQQNCYGACCPATKAHLRILKSKKHGWLSVSQLIP